MLSYRHAFHAGNFAYVLKHIVLVEILQHLVKKDSPFEYIDTHSGAGLYNLKAADAQMRREYAAGIGALTLRDFPEIARYAALLRGVNADEKLEFYPGSPLIAREFLRAQDRAWLFELHPTDFEVLKKNFCGKRVQVRCEDGFAGLQALLPPSSRRGLVFVDPSYEIKADYDLVRKHIVAAHQKFGHGVYAIWYPVVDRRRSDTLIRDITRSGIKNVQRFEIGIAPDSLERGMTAAGLIVINPPWTLFHKLSELLPKLAMQLAPGTAPRYKCERLVGE